MARTTQIKKVTNTIRPGKGGPVVQPKGTTQKPKRAAGRKM